MAATAYCANLRSALRYRFAPRAYTPLKGSRITQSAFGGPGNWRVHASDHGTIPLRVAIGPLALILPPKICFNITEGHHPHVPSTPEFSKVVKDMTPADRNFASARAGRGYDGRAAQVAAARTAIGCAVSAASCCARATMADSNPAGGSTP